MRSRTALLETTLLAAGLIVASPRLALSPGPLTRGHEEITSDCLACHLPLRGLPAARCIGCHPLDSIGISPRPERPAGADSVLAGMHRSFSRTDCLECHTDHAGPDSATRSFSHEALSPEFGRECTTCHDANRPADELHRQAGNACGDCHTTRAWKPATFDHQKTIKGTACSACHGQRRPADELHRQVGDDCGACHTTTAWKPATFEHDRYFVLDRDHQASCRTCHTEAGTYKSYTCYGCHEHTQGRMTAKHQEEGILDFRDCVRCHRSADEHEGGREGGGEHREGGREHEHSD